jgi:tetratricopeptide (TPR) repeat protein
MSRWTLTLLVVCVAPFARANPLQTTPQQTTAQQTNPPQPAKPPGGLQKRQPAPPATKEEIPPEEDKSIADEEFSFNPLQAQKWVEIGNYYFKQGKYRSAEGRYKGATKWNEGYGEAWLRLGEVEEKLKDPKAAKEAYTKYLELSPDAKNVAQIRKKVEKLK